MGKEQRVRMASRELVRREYFVTVPSSEPTMKKSLVAATAVWLSVTTSMMAGSSSEPC